MNRKLPPVVESGSWMKLRQTDWRSAVMFTGGFIGVIHETLFRGVDRPTLLMLFGGMMGLPAFFGKDSKAGRSS